MKRQTKLASDEVHLKKKRTVSPPCCDLIESSSTNKAEDELEEEEKEEDMSPVVSVAAVLNFSSLSSPFDHVPSLSLSSKLIFLALICLIVSSPTTTAVTSVFPFFPFPFLRTLSIDHWRQPKLFSSNYASRQLIYRSSGGPVLSLSLSLAAVVLWWHCWPIGDKFSLF